MVGDLEGTVTGLLNAIRSGDGTARKELFEVVYDEMRQMAAGLMRQERSDHTLQPTALAHEAVLRLLGNRGLGNLRNRASFFAAVGRAMRRILVEHARRRATARRGGEMDRVPLDGLLDYSEQQNLDVIALHEAVDELSKLSDRQAQVIELRFFAGFTVPQIAEQLDVSVGTVESDFRKARAFLRGRLEERE